MDPLQKVLCKLFFCRSVKNRLATAMQPGTRNVANGSVLKDQKKYRRGPEASPYVHEGVHPVKCNARFWNRQPHLWMPQLCTARNFLFRRVWRCLPKNSATLVRSLPVQTGLLAKSGVQTVLLQGRSNTGLATANATRGNAGTRNVANGSVLKDQKKIRRGPGASPYVREGVHPVKCNARFLNRQPHLWMPQLCIARNFLFRRGGDASQKTLPLWYDLFRSFAGPVKHRSSNSKCNQRQCRDQECCKWVRAKRSKKIPARPRGEPIRA